MSEPKMAPRKQYARDTRREQKLRSSFNRKQFLATICCLLECHIGQVKPLLNAHRLSILLLAGAEKELRRPRFLCRRPDFHFAFLRHHLLFRWPKWRI